MTRDIAIIHQLLHDALEGAASGDDREAANAYAVAADAIAAFGSSLWARDVRNLARQHAVTAWLRDQADEWPTLRFERTHVSDVFPFAYTRLGERPVVLGANYGASSAPGEVHRWRARLRSGLNAFVRVTRRGGIGWDRALMARTR